MLQRVCALLALLLLGLSCAIESPPGGRIPELATQVEIRRTEYGVPHIRGESLAAVAFGLAYCQAEDHLLNIMERMLSARGELAKHFGEGEDGATCAPICGIASSASSIGRLRPTTNSTTTFAACSKALRRG